MVFKPLRGDAILELFLRKKFGMRDPRLACLRFAVVVTGVPVPLPILLHNEFLFFFAALFVVCPMRPGAVSVR